MPIPQKRFKYQVSDAWGSMKERFDHDAVIIDTYHGDEHDYTVMKLSTVEIIGGWHATFMEEVTDPELLKKLADAEAQSAPETLDCSCSCHDDLIHCDHCCNDGISFCDDCRYYA